MQTIQQFSAWFSKQKLGGKLAFGCGGLFVFFCLCFISAAVLSPSPSNVGSASTTEDVSSIQTSAFDTAVAGIYQTATANAPTITPFPTITPVPNTPTITSSPLPTLTAQATVTPDIYEISIREKVPAYAEAFLQVLTYNQEVAYDMSLLFDTDWKIKQGFALGILELQANEMAELQPSSKYVVLHSIIIELATETSLFTDTYAKGVDNLDAELIDQATQHLAKINELMDKATIELKRIEANP